AILSIWPNPASDFVQLEFPQDVVPHNLILLDAYGRTVRESLNPNTQNKLTIGIQGLANAVYYIASTKDRKLVGRFIVNKP
ncbi:MAG: T9SS type A sorting domain-containing protein, partial [Flavobacteriales bacterium]|nr:T9SS type A sorting domain-containing protein [Flavobacteriales bacterium]